MNDTARETTHAFHAFELIGAGVEDLSFALALGCDAKGDVMSNCELTGELLRPRAHPVNVAAFVIGT
jgi:hypothetical protein